MSFHVDRLKTMLEKHPERFDVAGRCLAQAIIEQEKEIEKLQRRQKDQAKYTRELDNRTIGSMMIG